MKTFAYYGAFLACVLLTGCGGDGADPHLPPPGAAATANDVMRVGDKITIRLTGVPDGEYFNEVEIPSSGDVTVPLLTEAFHAAGHATAELQSEIADAYKAQKIYTNPVVIVLPEDRFVNVGGDVRAPGRIPYTPDSTLMSVINACGGFDEYANRHAVRIIRGQQVYVVDCVKAEGGGLNPSVSPGDQIWVPRTPF
ncbi:MAG TPA: polysaccharide biosynthesis/export family protein [Candidatus Methylacidiphilales bacterium]|jgi:protein involved in polysaccharide export with SLBB domain|nr:polysaccharide biosynthesis/export family protein [Candidatus Methylacidiphilales bacterium]